MYYTLRVLVVLLLVGLNAFFVAAEFAAVGARRSRLEELAKRQLLARWALRIKNSLDLYLSACQLGITLASLGLGFATEEVFVALFQPLLRHVPFISDVHGVAVVIGLSLSTALHVIVGEVAPKNVAIRIPDRLLPVLAPPLMAFTALFYPAIWVLNSASNGLLRLFGIRLGEEEYQEPLHSMNEIRSLLNQSFQEGGIAATSRQVLLAAFEFDDRAARQIMTPRLDVSYFRVGQSTQSLVDQIRTAAYTRYPLCEGGTDNIVGLIHMKDIFHVLAEHGAAAPPPAIDLMAIKREILTIPDSLDLPRLLRQFQRGKVHMAAVVDEYGTFQGIATLEDVIEELVGEIDDEFDERSHAPIRKVKNGYRVLSTAQLHLVAEVLDLPGIKECTESTLNGYLLEALGRIPRVGDVVTLGNFKIHVMKALSRRRSVVLIKRGEKG
jgi:CBS domain containing-hemolysin-like protein